MIRERGASMGFVFGARTRVYNTFDAHRLLHWAGIKRRQLMLKLALLRAFHTDGKDPGKRDVLVEAAELAGLDVVEARKVLESDDYADEVRAEEREYQGMGIQSVPSVIFNNRYLVTGGQPLWKPSSKPSGKFLPKRSPRQGARQSPVTLLLTQPPVCCIDGLNPQPNSARRSAWR